MNYKRTEELLNNYKMLKISIDNMKQEIEEIKKEGDTGVGSIEYDKEKVSPTFKITSQVEDIAIRNIEKVERLQRRIEVTESKIQRIDNAIHGLNDIEMEVVQLKYIEGLKWWQVAYKIRYSERHCKRVRTDAIKKLAIGIFGEVEV